MSCQIVSNTKFYAMTAKECFDKVQDWFDRIRLDPRQIISIDYKTPGPNTPCYIFEIEYDEERPKSLLGKTISIELTKKEK